MDSPLERPQLVVVVVLVVVNLALLATVTSSASAFGPYNDEWDGTSKLRKTASDRSAVELAITTEPYESPPINDSLAVVLTPARPSSETDMARIRQFVARGGTLVVGAENANRANPYLDAVGASARLDGRPLVAPETNYRSPELAVAPNVTSHRLTEDVERLTLNRGTVVRPGNATVLARTTVLAFLDENRNLTLDDGEPIGPFAVATVEQVGDGHVVVVSDASLFTNAMQERDGNKQFVEQLVGDNRRVILDHTQDASLPPLVYAVLYLRTTPWAQFVVGVGALALVGLWARRPTLTLPTWRQFSRRDVDTEPPQFDAADVTALLQERHPDWDRERIERVTEAILRQRGDG